MTSDNSGQREGETAEPIFTLGKTGRKCLMRKQFS